MHRYPEFLRTLLVNRGLTSFEEAERFLHPDYERDLHDPFLILNMDKCVERILLALVRGERITIWGDYDCDGIPGSVILHDFFQKIGYKNFEIYIPHRYREGYGLNIPAIEKLAGEGVTLIITVDSGITDVEPVARANKLGLDVIVTDHHLPQEKLPQAYAVINSKQTDDPYPFKYLSGAGVAYKLVQAMIIKLRSNPDASSAFEDTKGYPRVPSVGWEKWLLDLAGIAAIADMVPLTGENRVLAHFGLKVLRRTPRSGMLSLFRLARLNNQEITEEDVGFSIAPRINAASRMDEPRRAFELLSTRNPVAAMALAEHLEKKNSERKFAVSEMLNEVDRLISIQTFGPVLVVGHESWRPGVVGLAASRIVEKYQRTAFVWGGAGSADLRGSCRSDGSVNIVSLMQAAARDLFLDFGGHERAGGFSLSRHKASSLSDELQKAHSKIEKTLSKERQFIDLTLDLNQVTLENFELINRLAPFGIGNPRPLFLFENVPTFRVSYFGKNREHLKLDFRRPDGAFVNAVKFFALHIKLPAEGEPVTFSAHIERDLFNSRGTEQNLRLRIVDFI